MKDTEGVNEIKLVPSTDGTKEGQSFLTGLDLSPTYIWTFWARADIAGDIVHTEFWGGGGLAELALTTTWKKYQSRGRLRPDYRILYFWGLDSNKGNVYVKLPYLYKN